MHTSGRAEGVAVSRPPVGSSEKKVEKGSKAGLVESWDPSSARDSPFGQAYEEDVKAGCSSELDIGLGFL